MLSLEVFKQGYSQIDFSLTIEPNLPKALIDREQINRALVNLIGNAIDAIGELGERRKGVVSCKVSFNYSVNRFMIVIRDNGPGIPESIRDKIFDPYVSSKAGGTDLALQLQVKL